MKGIQAKRLVSALLVGAAVAHCGSAMAQEIGSPADSSQGADAQVGEIIVTARKRAERTLDVPTSITALGSTEIAKYGTTSLENLGNLVPQLQITHNPTGTGAIVTIRGIGTNNGADDGVEQAVSLNIDGVSTSRGRILQSGLFDIDNVQVLKGPQALYFGKNSPGGVIILNTKGPSDRLEGYVRAGYEIKAAEFKAEAAIGGPLTDTLGFRVAVQGANMTRGYVRNVSAPISAANNPIAYDHANGIALPGRAWNWGPESKQIGGRLTLAWEPVSDLSVTYKIFASHYKDNGEASTVQQLACPAGYPNGAMRDLGALAFGLPIGVVVDPAGNCNPKDRQSTIGALPAEIAAKYPHSNGGVPFSKTDNVLSSLTLNYKLGDIDLTSITGYYWYKNRNFSTLDYATFGLVALAVEGTNRSWTQEVRAVSSFGGPFDFSVGAFYENVKRQYNSWGALARAADPVTGRTDNAATVNTLSGETLSVVGELTWRLADNLELAGGARYTHETKDTTQENVYVQPGTVSSLGFHKAQGIALNVPFKANNVSPQVTLSWKPIPTANLFVGYRTGFKSGGVSSPNFVPRSATEASVAFDNEKVRGVEAGVKFEGANSRLRGSFTMYHYTYSGLQVSAFDTATNAVIVRNAAGAQVDGIEADLSYAFSRDFSVHGSLAYNRARYNGFKAAQCFGGQTAAQGCVGGAQDLSGEPLPRAPDWAGSAGFTYSRDLSNDTRLSLSVDARYSGAYFFSATNSIYARQGDFALVDASLRLEKGNRFELALIGKNLTDTFYATFASDRAVAVTPGSLTGVAGAPRTVEVQATFRF